MAYFFSQMLYAVSAIICITYLLASASFRDLIYVTIDKTKDAYLDKVAHATCWITLTVSLAALVAVRLHVTHFMFPCLAGLFLGAFIPGVCVYGVVVLKDAPSMNDTKIQDIILKRWWNTGKHYSWMNAVQRDRKCCGLKQPSDYRAFIYNRNPKYKAPLCENEKFDIPPSCINLQYLHTQCEEKKKEEFCNAHKFMEDVILFSNETLNEEMNNLETVQERNKFKCEQIILPSGNGTKLNLAGIRNGTVHVHGCWIYIKSNVETLRTSHHIIFFMLMVFSFIMLVVFIAYWMEETALQTHHHNTLLSIMKKKSKAD